MGMWKESYRIGIEAIDQQHEKLFEMVEDLLNAIGEEEAGNKPKYESAIAFMKDYVVKHFQDEEAYQASIQYPGLREHQELHRAFTNTVLEYERRLLGSQFALQDVKEFAGTLLAWLIYHVADADQKIAGKNLRKADQGTEGLMGCMAISAEDVLQKVAGVASSVEGPGKPIRDIVVKIGLTGEASGAVLLGFSKEFALCIVRIMTAMDADEVDELVLSAMAEISNIIAGNAATMLSEQGSVVDICPPEAVVDGAIHWADGQQLQSEIGWLSIGYLK